MEGDDWILPSPLDDTSLRSGGVSVLQKRHSSGFGLVLNLQLFAPNSVRFTLTGDRFLRVQAVDRGRRAGNKVFARKIDVSFPIPDFVDMNRIVVEWYQDDFVYVRERRCNLEHDKVKISVHVIDMGSHFPPQTAPCSGGASLPPEDAPTVRIQPPVASSSEGFRKDLIKTIGGFIQACASIAGEQFDEICIADGSTTRETKSSNTETSGKEASSQLPTMKIGKPGQHASTQTNTNEVFLQLNKGLLPEVSDESNVKDASTQAATDEHKVVFPITNAPLFETAVPSQGTDTNWESYCKKVAKRFESVEKNDQGQIQTPIMMGTSFRTTPYNTRRAMNGFHQLKQSLKYLNYDMLNFLHDSENYFNLPPYIFHS